MTVADTDRLWVASEEANDIASLAMRISLAHVMQDRTTEFWLQDRMLRESGVFVGSLGENMGPC